MATESVGLRAQLRRGGPTWCTDRLELRPAHLRALLDSHDGWARRYEGRRVAVSANDPAGFLFALVLLDGVCDAILLLPRDLPEATAAELARRAEVDVVLGASWIGDAGLSHAPLEIDLSGGDIDASAGSVADLRGTRVTDWIIPTSGTTSAPKIIAHTLASLTRSVKLDAPAFRWGMLYDPARFAGLQVFFQSFYSSSTLIVADPGESLEARAGVLLRRGCDALSATPTMWRQLLRTDAGRQLPLRQVTLGGEIADGPVLSALRTAYPEARITHIYASTEAGVGFAVHDAREGFPSAYLAHPPAGVEIGISPDGLLLLRARGHEQRLVGADESLYDENGWIDTGDLVQQEGDRLLFRGRANGSINVGGSKVFPEEVERIICEVDGVAQAQVTGRKSSIVGTIVQAAVVPSDSSGDSHALVAAIRNHCRTRLAAYKVPAIVTIVSSIGMNSTGKTARN